MKVLISGATGLVGFALYESLRRQGHEIVRLVRSVGDASGSDIVWDPLTGQAEISRFEGFDGVVHLAGDNIASGRWNEKKKIRIRESRVRGTINLTKILSKLERPPKVFVTASAIGYYGNRGEEILDEQSSVGKGFLSEVCQEWEAASAPAAQKGIRTVNLRIGVILSPLGGALKTMLLPFKLGMGGILGSGEQYMSWVALDDVIGIIEKVMAEPTISGPLNAVAPGAVTNKDFTAVLGDVLVRPTLFPMPAFAARLAFGEMADALLLSSTRVTPKKLLASGYKFRFSELKGYLEKVLLSD